MKTFFMNNGDFDVRAMLTMGVSAKSEDAIGFFGTGFKYAVAIVLRLGGSIKISTQSGVYEFSAKTENIRGKEFEVVYCNDQEAGFTTRMGINWEPWMAFRELYCNATDEGGEVADKVNLDYDTIIEVDCEEIAKAYRTRDTYFLSGDPIYSNYEVEIYDKRRPFIYYRGVAVADAPDKAMYSYNITTPVDLTEDRTLKHSFQAFFAIQRAWQRMVDKKLIRSVVKQGDHWESFDPDWGASDEFVEVCQTMLRTTGIKESARKVVEKIQSSNGDWPEFELSRVQQKQLDKATSHLAKIDINVNMFPIKTVTGLGDGVMGRALDGVIYLSEVPFNMGTKQVASTLMEEWVHNKYGCEDFDRQMQNWLFDKILSLSEEINEEPL